MPQIDKQFMESVIRTSYSASDDADQSTTEPAGAVCQPGSSVTSGEISRVRRSQMSKTPERYQKPENIVTSRKKTPETTHSKSEAKTGKSATEAKAVTGSTKRKQASGNLFVRSKKKQKTE